MTLQFRSSLYLLALLGLFAATANGDPQHTVPLRDWALQSACNVKEAGDKISGAEYQPADWHKVSVPSTVVAALVADHTLPDPYGGTNIVKLPGYVAKYDFSNFDLPADSPYNCGWWYRTEFTTPAGFANATQWLNFDGINYRANIWLNGVKLADAKEIAGPFRAYQFNLKGALSEGKNVLAVEVFAPQGSDLGITWWDWNPTPPDKDMGLWKDVYLSATGPVSLRYPTVTSKISPLLNSAELTMQVDAENDSATPVRGVLKATMEGRRLQQTVELAPGEKKTVRFASDKFAVLKVANPKLWWPYQMGTPNLHDATFTFGSDSKVSDSAHVRFGIREITSELDKNQNRLFKVNGRRVFIKGGGWSSDMLLRQWPKRLRDQFAHVRNLNLNTIRLEGKMETDAFFDLADEQGILIMAGWMCCDAWQLQDKWTPETHVVAKESERTQLLRLRGHPSMLVWLYGSDEPPREDIEREYLQVAKETEWPNPLLSSASATPAPITGTSGVKMSGPYDYVPPLYWFHPHAQSLTLGGGFSFNTETSPGPAIPTIESLKNFLPADKLWPINEAWSTHAGGNEFAKLDNFNDAMNATYGTPTDLHDFLRKSQAMAYEGERAMYEAYSGHRYNATGIIQWMLNNAWPSIYWHLYDYYLQGAGGYYGARKANEAVHVQYSYDDRGVVAVNNLYRPIAGVRLSADLYDNDLKKISSQKKQLTLAADGSERVLEIPQSTAPVSFLKLQLQDAAGKVLSSNFYWLAADQPTFDWDKTTYVHTPSPKFATLTALNQLPEVEVKSSASTSTANGRQLLHVMITNPSKALAFQIALRAYGKKDGSDILPVLWDDNYISLLPGESRTVTASMAPEDLHGDEAAVEVSGWNVKTSTASPATPGSEKEAHSHAKSH
jgi:exo-1,4-beta-D-glucosaminidase